MIRSNLWRLAAAAVGLAAVAALVVLIVILVGGDGNSTAGPDTTGGPSPSPAFPGGTVIEAATYYVTTVGLSGTTYEVTNPINCNAFAGEDSEGLDADGKICLDLNSGRFAEKQGTIAVRLVGEEKAWDLTMTLGQKGWLVVRAKAVAPGS